MSSLQNLRSTFAQKLKDFAAGKSTFTILHTITPKSSDRSSRPLDAISGSGPVYVLDSSFNPPTRAHLEIALSALRSRQREHVSRLLLLLATQNADKAAKPAAFEERLVMMTLLGEAVRDEMQQAAPHVDIGLTKMPYFHDKAASIDRDGRYADLVSDHRERQESSVEQIYLIGYDSLVRIFDRKYYPPDKGFQVLDPFMKHRLRVTMRTDGQWGDKRTQEEYVREVGEGKREEGGISRLWRDRIELVEGKREEDEAVSSTEARRAANHGDSGKLERMVIPTIRGWIESQGLYQEKKN